MPCVCLQAAQCGDKVCVMLLAQSANTRMLCMLSHDTNVPNAPLCSLSVRLSCTVSMHTATAHGHCVKHLLSKERYLIVHAVVWLSVILITVLVIRVRHAY
jgi:hypothetical protein